MNRKRKNPGKRRGNSSIRQEMQYQLARGLFGGDFESDEQVQERVFAGAFLPGFAKQKKEVEGIVNVSASINLFRFLGRVLVTKDTAKDLLLKRWEREKNKFTLTREEAAAKFIARLDARGGRLPRTRPASMKRASGNPRSAPRPGSWKQDIDYRTVIKNFANTDKDFKKMIVNLQNLINAMAALDNTDKKGRKMSLPKISVSRLVSKG